jgi:hypothetical protein
MFLNAGSHKMCAHAIDAVKPATKDEVSLGESSGYDPVCTIAF